MKEALWRELRLSLYAALPLTLTAVLLSLSLELPLWPLIGSVLCGLGTHGCVQVIFIVSAYGFATRFLSPAVVLYRALYAYILKYAVLIMLFFIALHCPYIQPLSFILSFCAALLLRLLFIIVHPLRT